MVIASGPAAPALRAARPKVIGCPPNRATARADTAPGLVSTSLTMILPARDTIARTVSPCPAAPPTALPPPALPPPPLLPPPPTEPLESTLSHWSSVATQLRTWSLPSTWAASMPGPHATNSGFPSRAKIWSRPVQLFEAQDGSSP